MFLGYVLTILMGFSLGLLGSGGSILTVPILVYFFKIEPQLATIDSLFIVGSTATLGVIKNFKQRTLDITAIKWFLLPSILGVYVAKHFVVPLIPETIHISSYIAFSKNMLLMTTFSILMLLSALSMLFKKNGVNKKTVEQKSILFIIILVGYSFFVGFITGFVGAGGGFLIIPALVFLFKLPTYRAVTTSLFIISINSFVGFITSIQSSYLPNWSLLFSLLLLSFVGLAIGSNVSKKLDDSVLRKIFAIFVLLVATFIFTDQFGIL